VRLPIALACGLLLFSVSIDRAPGAAPAPAFQQVLFLTSYDPNLPVVNTVVQSALASIQRNGGARVEVFTEHLDSDRFGGPDGLRAFEETFRHKYARSGFDVVLAIGAPALRFAMEHRQSLWPQAQVVYGGMRQTEIDALSPPKSFRGVATEFEFLATVKEALRLLPDTRNLFVVYGCAESDQSGLRFALETLRAAKLRLAIEPVPCSTIEEYRQRLSTLPPNSMILWGFFRSVRGGQSPFPIEGVKAIIPLANAPVVPFWANFLQAGALGGKMYDGTAAGTAMGSEVSHALRGDPYSGPLIVDGRWTWNWPQLKRYGISEDQLLPSSIVVNHNPTPWQVYRGWIVGASAFGVSQALLIAFLLVERARRARMQQRLHELSGGLLRAQEDERRRIARDLHDDVNQRLGLLTIELGQLQQAAPQMAGPIASIAGKARDLSSSVHELAHQIHPSKLEALGLVPAVREICREVALRHGINIEVESDDATTGIDPATTLCVYRVIQEALQNVVRHSGADEVRVFISTKRGRLIASVSDNGKGLEPAALASAPGLGLAGMSERLRLVQGRLKVSSAPGKGVCIQVSIPKEAGAL